MENDILFECTLENGTLSGLTDEFFRADGVYRFSFKQKDKFYLMTPEQFERLLSDAEKVTGGKKLTRLIVSGAFEVTSAEELSEVLTRQCAMLNRTFSPDKRYRVSFSEGDRGLIITVHL